MQRLQNYLQKISKSQFVKNLGITFSENIITKIMGFFITLMLIRNLGPQNYGVYSFVFVNICVFSSLFDFGMENTAIRFSNYNKEKQNAVFGLYFLTKSIILVLCFLVIILFGEKLLIGFNKPELIKFLPFFVLGFLGESLFFVNDTYLQAIQKFKLRAIINITRYIVLLCFVSWLCFTKLVLLKYIMFVFIIPLLFTLFFIPRYIVFIKSYFLQKFSKPFLTEIFHYEKWMFVLATLSSVASRIDIYMLSIWVSYAQLGIYSAAFNLVSIVSFLPNVLGKVMLPKMAETKVNDLFKLTIGIVKPIAVLSLLLTPIIPLFPYIVPLLFGPKYNDSVIIVQILAVLTLLSMILLPFEQALYPLGKPKYSTILRFIQLIITILINFIFIPRFGIVAAALNLVFAKIIYGILLINVFNTEKRKAGL